MFLCLVVIIIIVAELGFNWEGDSDETAILYLLVVLLNFL